MPRNATSSRSITADPAKAAEIGPSFTDIVPFALWGSDSVSAAPGRHAATAGTSAKICQTVAGGCMITKLSSNRVQPVRGSSSADAVAAADGAAVAAALFGTKVASGIAGDRVAVAA